MEASVYSPEALQQRIDGGQRRAGDGDPYFLWDFCSPIVAWAGQQFKSWVWGLATKGKDWISAGPLSPLQLLFAQGGLAQPSPLTCTLCPHCPSVRRPAPPLPAYTNTPADSQPAADAPALQPQAFLGVTRCSLLSKDASRSKGSLSSSRSWPSPRSRALSWGRPPSRTPPWPPRPRPLPPGTWWTPPPAQATAPLDLVDTLLATTAQDTAPRDLVDTPPGHHGPGHCGPGPHH
ncbi:vegetative cell wall protein gp1-like [Perognathus longimembris pacificus]|uniref:vegetative cell wall protein gp1-like n=1 Tax=Perognathus longimembris pacificus TaxID=214514 RepID=UPI0020194D25|nr:vegetative cell wall protein gp1-like [Perognathus longimembris pacificus]